MIRVVLYSHDSVGLGHVRRNLAIAHALAERLPLLTGEQVTGLLISSQAAAASSPLPVGWDWVVLPGIEPATQGYRARRLNADLHDMTKLRGRMVRSVLHDFAPDLVVVDRHPFGVARELQPALTSLRLERPECAIVLGMREVLDSPEVVAKEWHAIGGGEVVRQVFDQIWSYGDKTVHDPATTGEFPDALIPLIRSTGFLSVGRVAAKSHFGRDPFVLTTVGGGADGFALASAAARATLPVNVEHVIVTGPQMPDEHREQVRAEAREGVRIVRQVPDVLALTKRAAAVISMGGYNTVTEVMSTNVPALVVPRVERRMEQLIRARGLEVAGAIDFLHPGDLKPKRLGAWATDAVGRRVDRSHLQLNGLETVAEFASSLVLKRRGRDATVPPARSTSSASEKGRRRELARKR